MKYIKERSEAMIPSIQKILYATDLSPNSAYAFRYAINSAQKHDARIVILHVFEHLPGSRAAVGWYFDEELKQKIFQEKKSDIVDRIRKRLETFCEKELGGNAGCADRVLSIEICEGYPENEILRVADDFECDAIVMGTHGKGLLRHTFLGSTARKVLRRVRKPIFIIPLPEGETDVTFHDN